MPVSQAIKDAITRAAREGGVDPSIALAVAERESRFDPQARNSKTIAGLFQMQGGHRHRHGAGDSADPYTQAKAWTGFIHEVKGEMAGVLGHAPTDAESYLGHHFGGARAARMMRMDPSTPVDAVFSPNEMEQNPHFGRAGTVGKLNSSVLSDISKRSARYGGGDDALPSSYGELVGGTQSADGDADKPPSAYGELIGQQTAQATPAASVPTGGLASFGMAPPQPDVGRDAPSAAAPNSELVA